MSTEPRKKVQSVCFPQLPSYIKSQYQTRKQIECSPQFWKEICFVEELSESQIAPPIALDYFPIPKCQKMKIKDQIFLPELPEIPEMSALINSMVTNSAGIFFYTSPTQSQPPWVMGHFHSGVTLLGQVLWFSQLK